MVLSTKTESLATQCHFYLPGVIRTTKASKIGTHAPPVAPSQPA